MEIELSLVLSLLFAIQTPAPRPQSPSSGASREPALTVPLRDVVESERAFARLSVEKGQRAALLAFFADDALLFGPEPVNAKKAIDAWPVVSAAVLDREPRFAGVSDDGTLGYTTGPWLRTAKTGEPPAAASGWYFTIRRQQPDGCWQVAVDVGIDSPPAGALRPVAVTVAPRSTNLTATDARGLPGVDQLCARVLETTGAPSAFTARGTDTVRVYRNGLAPMSGRPSAGAHRPI
jgi:ketosteroid isomerase-like protein